MARSVFSLDWHFGNRAETMLPFSAGAAPFLGHHSGDFGGVTEQEPAAL